jgi:hypothetical protein
LKLLVLPALTLRSIEATVWARSSHLADRVGALAARRPAIVLALWSVVYFAATASLASRKLLWDDEFFPSISPARA